MTIKGHIHNGVAVPDEPVTLPEGAAVEILVVENEPKAESPAAPSTVWQRIQTLRGIAPGLPSNAADNHDSYLSGTADNA